MLQTKRNKDMEIEIKNVIKSFDSDIRIKIKTA